MPRTKNEDIESDQQDLVRVPIEQLAHEYNTLFMIREQCATRAGYWRGKCGELDKQMDPKLALIRQHANDKNTNKAKTVESVHAIIAKMESEQPEVDGGVE